MEFRESQKFNQWWLWLLMIGVLGLTAWGGWKAFLEQGDIVPGLIGVGVTALMAILLALIELRTTITADGIEARFWPIARKRIFSLRN
jgi:TRAP-type C4-dicarboxylate transport system permease small subunit